MKQNGFAEIFSGFIREEALLQKMKQGRIVSADMDMKQRSMEIQMEFPCFIAHTDIFQAEDALRTGIRLRHFRIIPHYPRELLTPEVFPSLVEFLRQRIAGVNGIMDGATVDMQDDCITITLTHEMCIRDSAGSCRAVHPQPCSPPFAKGTSGCVRMRDRQPVLFH